MLTFALIGRIVKDQIIDIRTLFVRLRGHHGKNSFRDSLCHSLPHCAQDHSTVREWTHLPDFKRHRHRGSFNKSSARKVPATNQRNGTLKT